MIKINLIREGGRAAARGAGAAPGAAAAGAAPKNRNDLVLAVVAILGLLAAAGYWYVRYSERERLKEEVARQQIEAQKLEKIIKEVEDFQARKDSLEKRIKLINDLKQNQKGPVRLLDRISQDLPDLVWLDRMVVEGTKVSLNGRALNPNAFAYYVANIKADEMFDEPSVQSIRESGTAPGGQPVYEWAMSFNFIVPKPPEAAPAAPGAEGTPAAPPAAAGR